MTHHSSAMARPWRALLSLPAILASLSYLAITTATSLLPLVPRDDSSPDSTGFPRCYTGHGCPGLWPSVNPDTPKTLNDTLFAAVNDVALLAEAALKSIQAPHFDYFFERNDTTVKLVTTVFRNVADCAEGRTCQFSGVFADTVPSRNYPTCQKKPETWSYAPGGSTYTSSTGGGVVFMCPRGLALPRNPSPCTTDGNPTISLGYALLRAVVQSVPIVDPDNSGTLFDGLDITAIKELGGNTGDWDLADLGWGIDGDGLMGQAVANAANWAYFATLSWDLGNGPAPWTGRTCQSVWGRYASAEGLVPIS